MQPLKPEQKRAILENSPKAQAADMQEYERLLSLRFTEDPDQQPVAGPSGIAPRTATVDSRADRERRIQELHRKLFGSGANKTTPEAKRAAHG